jgi:hypothetical protein
MLGSSVEYPERDIIPFTVRVTGTGEVNVFKCPYGMGIRLQLVSVMAYNEAGGATSIKVFDHLATGAPTDPAFRGDATTPLFTLGIPTVDHDGVGPGTIPCPKEIFQQGMAVVCSQGTVVITANVREA